MFLTQTSRWRLQSLHIQYHATSLSSFNLALVMSKCYAYVRPKNNITRFVCTWLQSQFFQSSDPLAELDFVKREWYKHFCRSFHWLVYPIRYPHNIRWTWQRLVEPHTVHQSLIRIRTRPAELRRLSKVRQRQFFAYIATHTGQLCFSGTVVFIIKECLMWNVIRPSISLSIARMKTAETHNSPLRLRSDGSIPLSFDDWSGFTSVVWNYFTTTECISFPG